MKTAFPLISAFTMILATAGFAPPARAATIVITGSDTSIAACNSAIPDGTHCFFVNNKVTATRSGNSVTAINPVTASVGDTIMLTNQSGTHNVIFCKVGTTINGWNCGDPISSSGPEPGSVTASTAGAPAMITTGAPDNIGGGVGGYSAESYSTTLDSAGTFYFWCGLGRHRFGGQYGRLDVVGAQSAATTPPAATTATTTAPTSNESATSTAPTLTLKKASGKVIATGKATPGARVLLQKQVGKKWVTVASTKATASGTYTLRANAEAKKTTYRVSAGSRSSLTRRL